MLRVESVLTGVGGSPYFQRLNFSGESQAEAQAARQSVIAMWETLFTGVNPNIGRLTATVASEVVEFNAADGQTRDVFTFPTATVPPGSTTVGIVPNACQVMVRLDTGAFLDGRRVRGKVYFPCFNIQAISSDGNVAGTAKTQALAAIAGVLDNGLAIWSRPKANPARIGTLNDVTTASVWDEFAVLTSRRD